MSAPSTALHDLVVADAPVGVFDDRRHAGRELASLLAPLRAERPVVVGVPRGGVPVADEIAHALGAPLDVVLARKIGAPQNPEYALGAVAEGGVHVLSARATRALALSEAAVQALVELAEQDLVARMASYRGSRAALALGGRTVIVVDDGLATGRSARAAVRSVRRRGAARVILAVPVAAPQAVAGLRGELDCIACVEMPSDLWAVGVWYRDFAAVGDEQVIAALAAAPRCGSARGA
jgi:predicted phosphoribosyltransferase